MSYEEGCTLDYCLHCDNHTSEGAYCSLSCRLADLNTALYASSETSSSLQQPPNPVDLSRNSSSAPKGFYLPPAYDFGATRKACRTSPSSPLQQPLRVGQGIEIKRWSLSSDTSDSRLRSSSSRSSVSTDFNAYGSSLSHQSGQCMPQISDDARHQLELYNNSFDTTRYRNYRSLS